MKITEKALLDGYDGITKGGTKISMINGERIWWDYRTEEGGEPATVCSPDNAECITLENDRHGVVVIDSSNKDHSSIAKIKSDEAKLWGNEI